ncbi:MAG: ATP-dependent RecD-like DNA helicase [Lentisphaerae bacterium]|nr:ATP-dependent RecD-like DNA helicase [Lentisphaerota bacterium]
MAGHDENLKEAEVLLGTVESIVFRNDDNGYTVCSLKSDLQVDPVTLVGACAAIWPGETLKALGHWTVHKQHGRQFNAEQMICVEPYSLEGIQRYLAQSIKGIGPVHAERIVRKFGKDSLRIIEEESVRLLDVEGIGKVRREQIKEAWDGQKAVRDIMIFLHSIGVSVSLAARIYKQYGHEAVAIVKKNPYRLASDVWGIGFKRADEIAMNMGIPHDSPLRARAGLLHSLEMLADEGHCYWPVNELLEYAEQELDVPADKLEPALMAELQKGSVIVDKDRAYLARLYHDETETATHLKRLRLAKSRVKMLEAEKALEWAGTKIKITFADCQKTALISALTEKVSIITGGPGVGKTTIVRALVEIYRAQNLTTFLAAPTGRAAKRLEEATGQPASTIHRLLHFQPATRSFEFNASNPLDCDVIILDEVSMIDIALATIFLRAVPDRASIVFVGDADQLPSVGPGSFLKDMLESHAIPSVKLDRIFRQSERSWIVHNAHLVNEGQFFQIPDRDVSSDFYFIEPTDIEDALEKTIKLVAERIPARYGMNPLNDIQVLTPMRRLQLGAENLNNRLQEVLNPTGPSLTRYGRMFRMRDRVMQIRNNYDKEVFNGDIGSIASVDEKNNRLYVRFDTKYVLYESEELDEIMLAYATTIHKSQGSEHPAVVVLLATQHFKLLQRNLLYTAITRGRRLVCLIASKRASWLAIRNNSTEDRRTSLREKLQLPGRTSDNL